MLKEVEGAVPFQIVLEQLETSSFVLRMVVVNAARSLAVPSQQWEGRTYVLRTVSSAVMIVIIQFLLSVFVR